MMTLIRVSLKSLGALILKWRNGIWKTLVWVVRALVVWQVMWSSLISPAKIRMLAPPRVVSFRVWGVERFPLVVKGVGLFNLNGSLNLRKIWAVNGLVCRVIAYNAWLLYSRSIWC